MSVFHAIFHDEVGLYNEDKSGAPFWNFSYIDQIYDGLLANGVRPFVELSFMPNMLASGPPADFFWYRLNPSPPKENARWAAMIDAFVLHLVERYGVTEVEQWYFEVWNEPNLPFWTGMPPESSYYAFYDLTATTIKKVDAKLRVGGPSTAQAAWVDRFIAHCLAARVPFDFVSTHIYGNESPKDVFGVEGPVDIKDMVSRALTKVRNQVKSSDAPDTPIIISEFNAAFLNQTDIEDSAFMGPWLANTIRECDGLTTMMSYWTFSDVFEEQGVVRMPFYGGFGLIAERGIPKAAFNAFAPSISWAAKGSTQPQTTTWLQKGRMASSSWRLGIIQNPDTGLDKMIHLKFADGRRAKYTLQMARPGSGSPLEEWERMGSPAYPTPAQIARLIEAAQLPAPAGHAFADSIQLTPHELALVTVAP